MALEIGEEGQGQRAHCCSSRVNRQTKACPTHKPHQLGLGARAGPQPSAPSVSVDALMVMDHGSQGDGGIERARQRGERGGGRGGRGGETKRLCAAYFKQVQVASPRSRVDVVVQIWAT